MTDNNHTEEIQTLFKKAHKIEPGAADMAFHGSTGTEEEKRESLKEIISGEYEKRCSAGDASNNLRKTLMRLHMLGDLLEITDETDPPTEQTVWVAGDTILQWTEEAEEARSLLADRWSDLENFKLNRAGPS